MSNMTQLFTDASRWIWLDASMQPNRYMETICPFHADANTQTTLHISVEGAYAVYVNGTYVPSAQYADFPAAKAVERVNLTGFSRPGDNELLIQCWYPGEDTLTTRRETPGLRYELYQDARLEAYSGTHTQVRPMAALRTQDVPQITGQLGRGFAYRFAAEAPWQSAVCVEKEASCVARPVEDLRLGESRPSKLIAQGGFVYAGGENVGERMQHAGLFWQDVREMTGRMNQAFPSKDGVCFRAANGEGVYLVFDLGELYAGYLALDVVCPQDTLIDVGFGEHLADGRARTSVGGRCFGVTVTATSERKRLVHRLRRLGMRYLQLFIHSREATVYEASVEPLTYPVDEKTGIHLSDPLHDRIAQVCRKTLLSCMHEHYEDCPWREQALYAFDSRNQMLCGYYAFGEYTYARENLRLLSLSQREDGLLELCAPAHHHRTIPSFSMAFVVELEEYCRFSGDLAFGREMLGVCERILAKLESCVQDGLAWRPLEKQYWNFYEWQPLLDGYTEKDDPSADAGLQLFGLLALERLRALREMLGMPPVESERKLEAQLREGLEQFWDETEQAYASFIRGGKRVQYAELIQSLALYTQACPAQRQSALREKLLAGGLVPVTLSYSLFKYEALLQDERYTQRVFDEVARRWGDMLFAGATTFWEVDEGEAAFDRAGSLCHGWSAIPMYLYGAYGLGVRPQSPGVWTAHAVKHDLKLHATLRTPEGYYAAEKAAEELSQLKKLEL